MSRARTNILSKLKQQRGAFNADQLPPEPSYDYPVTSQAEQLDAFVQHLLSNHAEVVRLQAGELVEKVRDALSQRGIDTLMVGEGSPWRAELEAISSDVNLEGFYSSIDGNKDALFEQVPAALTGSYGAIAATGSIVLWPSAQEPRTLSLVPPLHLVVVKSSDIYPDFAGVIEANQWQAGMPTNVVLVSGPSKTADIQQTLAYGAHGPKELVVLLIED